MVAGAGVAIDAETVAFDAFAVPRRFRHQRTLAPLPVQHALR